MSLKLIAFAFAALLWSAPGHATTYYVSGNGTGTTCSSTSPCPYLSTALSSASAGDVIVCLSAPASTPLYIAKSVTIDCGSARASVGDGGYGSGDGFQASIFINIAVSSSDPLRTVRLRGIDVDGVSRSYNRGIDILSATAVYVEDCVVSNFSNQGIYDRRTGGQTKLFVTGSVISGNGGGGIVAASAATGITVIDNVKSQNNAYGVAAATGNNVTVDRSVMSGNSTAGIEGDTGAQIVVNATRIGHNNIGVLSASSVRLSNNDISFNNTAISGSTGSFGNNRFSGNVSIGTSPAALGGASSDLGQQ